MIETPIAHDVPAVVSLLEGSEVFFDERRWVILRIESLSKVFARCLEGDLRESRQIDIHALLPVPTGQENKVTSPDVDLLETSDEQWDIAKKRLKAIGPLLTRPRNATALARQEAAEIGVTLSTLYIWRDKYLVTEKLSSLLDAQRNGGRGKGRLDPKIEKIMADAITLLGEKPSEVSIFQMHEDVCTSCHEQKLRSPSMVTFRLRLDWLDQRRLFEKRRGKKAARSRFDPVKENTIAAHGPHAVVQIDHCVVNVIVVHDETRQPIYRPWLTIAIDVYSRVVVGIYLSLDNPSATSVGACLAHAILPKDDYLRRLGVNDVSWPVWGEMNILHMDNGSDFRSIRLARAMQEYKIEREFRAVGRPEYGGHIERLIGTFSQKFNILPGATTNKPIAKNNDYVPEAAASMTMLELERWLVEEINKYHHRPHSGIDDQTPLGRYEAALLRKTGKRPTGLPPRRVDAEHVVIDFLPEVKRTIQRDGVANDGRTYWADVLTPWIGMRERGDEGKKPLYRFKEDDRDVSRIFFWDENAKRWYMIPSRYTADATSRSEYRAAKKRLQKAGNPKPVENEIFDSASRQKRIVEASLAATAKVKTPTKKQKQAMKKDQQGRDTARRKVGPATPGVTPPAFELPDIDDLPPLDISF